MKKLYLIRHARPLLPEGRHVCLGQTDLPLSAAGLKEAAAAAALLRGREFKLYSSPLLRAVQTAEAFAVPFEIIGGLKEYGMGIWDGLSFDEIRLRYPELYEARARDLSLLPPGAEDRVQALSRFTKAVIYACEASQADTALVSHAGVMGLFLQQYCGYSVKPDYGHIICLTYNNRKFRLKGELSDA